jgi:hypothetical protein
MNALDCVRIPESADNDGSCLIFADPDTPMHLFLKAVYRVGLKLMANHPLMPQEQMIQRVWPHVEQLISYNRQQERLHRCIKKHVKLPAHFVNDYIKNGTLFALFRPHISKHGVYFHLPDEDIHPVAVFDQEENLSQEQRTALKDAAQMQHVRLFGSAMADVLEPDCEESSSDEEEKPTKKRVTEVSSDEEPPTKRVHIQPNSLSDTLYALFEKKLNDKKQELLKEMTRQVDKCFEGILSDYLKC